MENLVPTFAFVANSKAHEKDMRAFLDGLDATYFVMSNAPGALSVIVIAKESFMRVGKAIAPADVPTKSIADTMTDMVRFIETQFEGETVLDHRTTCCKTADQFGLWESDAEYMAKPLDAFEEHFPLWLSRVVEGIMRDKGIES